MKFSNYLKKSNCDHNIETSTEEIEDRIYSQIEHEASQPIKRG